MADARALEIWASKPYAYLTTTGRRTGEPHRIEIWFAVHDGRIYLMSGGRDRADWVRNVMANPDVSIELGSETYAGRARVIQPHESGDQLARELLVAKYASPANPLADWKKRSLPVVIELHDVDTSAASGEAKSR